MHKQNPGSPQITNCFRMLRFFTVLSVGLTAQKSGNIQKIVLAFRRRQPIGGIDTAK